MAIGTAEFPVAKTCYKLSFGVRKWQKPRHATEAGHRQQLQHLSGLAPMTAKKTNRV
jgi:hypothetical protein